MSITLENHAAAAIQRRLAWSNHELDRTLTRLASGSRITRAADDPAGSARASTLEAKQRSTRQARRNANDAVSMLQVAEGSANEIAASIKRLREILVQASSDTLDADSRGYLSAEAYQIRQEIDRVAGGTSWNALSPLATAAGGGANTFAVGASFDTQSQFGISMPIPDDAFWTLPATALPFGAGSVVGRIDQTSASGSGVAGNVTIVANSGAHTLQVTTATGASGVLTAASAEVAVTTETGGQRVSIDLNYGGVDTTIWLQSTDPAFGWNDAVDFLAANPSLLTTQFQTVALGFTVTSLDTTGAAAGDYSFSMPVLTGGSGTAIRLDGPSGTGQTIDVAAQGDFTDPFGDSTPWFNAGSPIDLNFSSLGVHAALTLTGGVNNAILLGAQLAGFDFASSSFNGSGATFTVGGSGASAAPSAQIGPDAADGLDLPTADLHAAALGLGALSSDTALSSASAARGLLDAADTALQTVNSFRATLGASQERLASVERSLDTDLESTAAALSRIEDADFAFETAQMARWQILQQSSVAMLAQAQRAHRELFAVLLG